MPPLHTPLLFFPFPLPTLSLPSPSSLVPATAATAAVSCQSVFVLLLALVAVVGATTRCQPGCVCNETLSLTCSDIRRLEAVPADVRSVTVTNAKTMDTFSSRPLGPAAANIVSLDLSSNALTTVTPDSFSGLANLVHLNLSGNHLHNITGDAFAGLQNLATLDLSHNRLSKLAPGVFSDLVNLTFLDLRDNDLPALPADLFSPLQSLEMLNLSQNSITHILAATFSNTSALQELDLSHNLLQTFHEDVLSSFANLYRVNLEGNPIDCSCAVQGLLYAYNNNTNNPDLFYNFQNLTCNQPASLAGKPVVSSFNLSRDVTSCESPGLDYVSTNMSRVSHQDVRLDCNATGSPGPSIVWVTPWGDLFAHNMHLHQLTSISQPFLMRHTYTDSKYTSDIYILSNGSLVIQNLRGYFGGRFRCLAINPLGNHSATLVLRVYSLIPSVYTTSLVVSFGASLSFLVLGVLLGAVRTLAIRVATRRGKNFKVRDQGPEIRPVEIEKTESFGGPRGLSGIAEGVVLTDALYYKTHNRTHSSDLPSFGSIPHLDHSPGASPPSLDGRGPGVRGGGVRGSGSGSGRDGDAGGEGEDDDGDDGDDDDDHYYAYYYYYYNDDGRCVKVCSPPPTPATPATPGSGLGAGPSSSGAHPTHPQQPADIRETLDEVRARLVDGVERRMLKMRWRVQTIRDTGSQYMHSIRDTGSQCVQTIRAGVVLGVEQVKCHVQSFRELCGTGGTMGAGSSSMAGGYGLEGGEEMTGSHHTISNVSVSTDVDTQTRTEIVKSYTYV